MLTPVFIDLISLATFSYSLYINTQKVCFLFLFLFHLNFLASHSIQFKIHHFNRHTISFFVYLCISYKNTLERKRKIVFFYFIFPPVYICGKRQKVCFHQTSNKKLRQRYNIDTGPIHWK